jgi:hypothetical protein
LGKEESGEEERGERGAKQRLETSPSPSLQRRGQHLHPVQGEEEGEGEPEGGVLGVAGEEQDEGGAEAGGDEEGGLGGGDEEEDAGEPEFPPLVAGEEDSEGEGSPEADQGEKRALGTAGAGNGEELKREEGAEERGGGAGKTEGSRGAADGGASGQEEGGVDGEEDGKEFTAAGEKQEKEKRQRKKLETSPRPSLQRRGERPRHPHRVERQET